MCASLCVRAYVVCVCVVWCFVCDAVQIVCVCVSVCMCVFEPTHTQRLDQLCVWNEFHIRDDTNSSFLTRSPRFGICIDMCVVLCRVYVCCVLWVVCCRVYLCVCVCVCACVCVCGLTVPDLVA